MASNNYILNVLSGLFSDKIMKIKDRIRGKYFPEKSQSQLFNFCIRFYRDTKTVPTFQVVQDAFKDKLWDVQEEIKGLLNQLNPQIDDALFQHSVEMFFREYKLRVVGDIQLEAVNVQKESIEQSLKKIKDKLSDINLVETDKFVIDRSSDEDYIQRSREEFLTVNPDDLEEGIKTGNVIIDRITGGGKRKKLWVIGAGTGELKSTQLFNFALEALWQHKNVFFCTVEMAKKEVKAILYSIHVYKKYGYMIDTAKMMNAALRSEQDNMYVEKCIQDFNQMGKLILFELPPKYSMAQMEAQLNSDNQIIPIDALFLDYLTLLKPADKRMQKHEEYESLFIEAKQLAMQFNNGKGIWVCTAHQVNTDGVKKVRKRGYYVLEDLAKTAEAQRSPDFILVNHMSDKLREQNEVKQNALKNRGGPLPAEPWICPVELACGAINPPLDTATDDFTPESIKI